MNTKIAIKRFSERFGWRRKLVATEESAERKLQAVYEGIIITVAYVSLGFQWLKDHLAAGQELSKELKVIFKWLKIVNEDRNSIFLSFFSSWISIYKIFIRYILCTS